jgi:hypothetical protein
MSRPITRRMPWLYALAALVVAWLLAWGGYRWADSRRMTAEKVSAFLAGLDFSKLSKEQRARVLMELAAKLNALSLEDRRRVRMGREWQALFKGLDDEEKSAFVEATLPTGIKQMLNAFEELPPDKRKRTVDAAVKQLQEARQQAATGATDNLPPVVSDAVREKAVRVGLRAYFSGSSAQTKAELAPLMEEMQHVMENGRIFFQGRGPR